MSVPPSRAICLRAHNYSTDIRPISFPEVPFVPMTRPAADAHHERVLVVSIDGLAPRVVTPTTMPNLCDLALAGASCFEARTVEPPITVPAHASMFHGVEPAVHHLVDNTRRRPDGPSRSFLAVARAAGRSTASVLCWLPLDELIEPDAADHRVALDSGYDPHDDDRRHRAGRRPPASCASGRDARLPRRLRPRRARERLGEPGVRRRRGAHRRAARCDWSPRPGPTPRSWSPPITAASAAPTANRSPTR